MSLDAPAQAPGFGQRLKSYKWAQAQYLPDAVRGALTVTLFSAPYDATPEKVLTDTFGCLGYLPDEAKQAALRILPQKSQDLRQRLTETDVEQAKL